MMPAIVHSAAPATPAATPELGYDAFERGDLRAAARCFAALLEDRETADVHYMLGLVHKYLLDWPRALAHNLRAQSLQQGFDESVAWNAAIAATALGDWAQVRRQWAMCGIDLSGDDGPVHANFGVACIRLNPWGDSETLYARRIDPVRAQLTNVPLPESGYRYGDIVLHDGAATGSRVADGEDVPVFNALARVVRSGFRTYTAYVRCDGPSDADALAGGCGPGIGHVEDWTQSIVHYCLRCSAGLPHSDEDADACDASGTPQWDPMRTVGVAAQSRRSVDRLLRDWKGDGAGRRVESIESFEHPTPTPPHGVVWWRLPADEANAGS